MTTPSQATNRVLGAIVVALLVAATALWFARPDDTEVGATGAARSTSSTTTTTAYTGPDPVIGAAGDIACDPFNRFFGRNPPVPGNCRDSVTADILLREGVDAVLPLGDIQYEQATLAQFEASYDRTWGRLKSITRPVPGNHEYDTPGAADYFRYFGAAAGPRDRGFYSFNLGAWHLIALNSNCNEVGCFVGSEQEEFLKADLAANRSRCTLAYWHTPRFSSGPTGDSRQVAPLWDALYRAGADVVLNANDHQYERFAPQDPGGLPDPARGIRQFVVGTGGDSLQSFAQEKANSEVRIHDTFGVLLLKLGSDGYEWTFVPENPDGSRDAGRGACN